MDDFVASDASFGSDKTNAFPPTGSTAQGTASDVNNLRRAAEDLRDHTRGWCNIRSRRYRRPSGDDWTQVILDAADDASAKGVGVLAPGWPEPYYASSLSEWPASVPLFGSGMNAGPGGPGSEIRQIPGTKAHLLSGLECNFAAFRNIALTGWMAPIRFLEEKKFEGGSLPDGTHYYVVVALNAAREVIGRSLECNVVTSGSEKTSRLAWTEVAGAVYYRVYGRTQGAETLYAELDSSTTTYDDTAVGVTLPDEGEAVDLSQYDGINLRLQARDPDPPYNRPTGALENIGNCDMHRVFLAYFSGNGVTIEEPISSTWQVVKAQNCVGTGFSFVKGTSNTFLSCYANNCLSAGYNYNQTAYSTLLGCAADSCGFRDYPLAAFYRLDRTRGMKLISCGAENLADSIAGVNMFVAWNARACGFDCCYAYSNKASAFYIAGTTGGSQKIRVVNGTEFKVEGNTTYGVHVASGSQATYSDQDNDFESEDLDENSP